MNNLPRITVAAVIERNGRFLFVEEYSNGQTVLNQPAGHLDPGEDLLTAVVRETREETTCHFTPEALTGIYQWGHHESEKTYLRFCFCGQVSEPDPKLELDEPILRTLWLHPDELRHHALRSPLVLHAIKDYLAGRRYPLDVYRMIDGASTGQSRSSQRSEP